jgi:hypothetical protein
MAQSDPSPAPDLSQIAISLRAAAASEKIQAPLEISPPIEANPISSTPWIVCIRSGAKTELIQRSIRPMFTYQFDYRRLLIIARSKALPTSTKIDTFSTLES